MKMPNVLVKVSDDLFDSELFLFAIGELQRKGNLIVVCVGGGTQINVALGEEAALKPHGPLGRELSTPQEKSLAWDTLQKNQKLLQEKFIQRGIKALVVIPIIAVGSVTCHMNGDLYVQAAYHGFDKICVATTLDRAAKKREQFKHLPKIEIWAI